MSVVVVAEKPSVGRDLARVLGANRKGEGFLEGNGYLVTWAIGHLVGLAEPAEVKAEWKRWDFGLLPMIPEKWPLSVLGKTRAQFNVLKKLLRDGAVERVVCATDAGREGELIFRFIYEAAGCRKPVQRLWISSLTDGAIREGFRKLKDGRSYDALAAAARARSQADWLVGMNLSRAYGLSMAQTGMSVGRVQTPTLAMVVARELEIRNFKPEDYLEVVATFEGETGARYKGTWFRPQKASPGEKGEGAAQARRLLADGVEAGQIVERARRGKACIEGVRAETKRMPPPLLYDLTELQRHANRLYAMSAQRTLAAAQALYERHKLLSYPRTDSRHLSKDVADTLPDVVRAVKERYAGMLAPGTGERPLGRRYVDDAKVSDHHAIIPTDRRLNDPRALGEDERRIYDLVCRRLLQAWHGEHVWDVTTVTTAITTQSPEVVDRYRSQGTAVREVGWKVLDPVLSRREKPDEDEAQALPAGLERGQPQRVVDAQAVKKTTRPPPRFTEATLLTAMETAGAALDDKELSNAMKERGLGTPATRAATIETLLDRAYIVRQGKALEATEKGVQLIAAVDGVVKSPAMTGEWEARLARMEKGQEALPEFMSAIERYVREVVGRVPPPSGRSSGGGGGAGWRSRTAGPAAGAAAEAPKGARRRPSASGGTAAPAKTWAIAPWNQQTGGGSAKGTKRRAGTGAAGKEGRAVGGSRTRRAGDVAAPSPAAAPGAVDDQELTGKILGALRTRDGQSTGRMCRTILGEGPAERQRFELLVRSLVSAGTLRLTHDVFETEGRKIPFQRAWLAP